jgi:ribonuclease P protein component
MQYTCSLKKNHEFRRLFARGKSRVSRPLVLYASRNSLGRNRLGISTGVKLGCAVKRNRVRRRIREAYRLNEATFKQGFDLVVVARTRAVYSDFSEICGALLSLADSLGLRKPAV